MLRAAGRWPTLRGSSKGSGRQMLPALSLTGLGAARMPPHAPLLAGDVEGVAGHAGTNRSGFRLCRHSSSFRETVVSAAEAIGALKATQHVETL